MRDAVLADRCDREFNMLDSFNDIPCRTDSTPCAGRALEPERAPAVCLGQGDRERTTRQRGEAADACALGVPLTHAGPVLGLPSSTADSSRLRRRAGSLRPGDRSRCERMVHVDVGSADSNAQKSPTPTASETSVIGEEPLPGGIGGGPFSICVALTEQRSFLFAGTFFSGTCVRGW